MAEVSHSAETETRGNESIAVQNDRTSNVQNILRAPRQQVEGMAEVSQLAETETSCHVSVAIQKACTSIKKKLNLPWTLPEQKILKVPPQLLEVSKKAYEPYIISIGPYHRHKDHLKEMGMYKVRYLQSLLERTEGGVESYLSVIGDVVEEARNCYAECLEICMEEFVEMMVLDGCFIIGLFMKDLQDPIFEVNLISLSLWHDLALVDNQLPFFVIWRLLDKHLVFENLKGLFIYRILEAFEWKMPGLRVDKTYDDYSIKNVKHIVHLLHSNWLPSNKAMEEYYKQPKDGRWDFIRSVTELKEAGIKFRKVETKGDVERSLFDIKFKKKIIEIPTVTIDDYTESLYRNLIACEQFDNTHPAFLTDYIMLMDSLINSGKDVELLCKRGIIDNCLGDDESVAVLFNRLGDHTSFSKQHFFYAQLFKDVNKHYKKSWNSWKANLRHKYFNTPWAFISFFAATLLLLLTVLQTTFTIFPRS